MRLTKTIWKENKRLITITTALIMILLTIQVSTAYVQNATFTTNDYALPIVSTPGYTINYDTSSNTIRTDTAGAQNIWLDKDNLSGSSYSLNNCGYGASIVIDNIIYCGQGTTNYPPAGLQTFNISGGWLTLQQGWWTSFPPPTSYASLYLDNKLYYAYSDKIIVYDYNGIDNATWNKNISIGAYDLDYDTNYIYANNGSYVKLIDRTTLTVDDAWNTGSTGLRSVQVYDNKIYTSARIFNTEGETIRNLPYGSEQYLMTDGNFYYVNDKGDVSIKVYNLNDELTNNITITASPTSRTNLITGTKYVLSSAYLSTITATNFTYDNITATITPETLYEGTLVKGYCEYNSTPTETISINATFYKNDIIYSTINTPGLSSNTQYNMIDVLANDTNIGDEIYLTCKANVSSTDTTDTKTVRTINNTLPEILYYTISDETPAINQTITITIIETNVEPEDVIHFGIKCEGTETNYTQNSDGQFYCTYNSSGIRNLTIAISDNFHVGTWNNETNITITVSSQVFTGGTLNVQVYDSQTNNYLVGATVTADEQNTTTDSFGRATITTSEETTYVVKINKTGYYDKYNSILADGGLWFVYVDPLTTIGSTNILITIEDEIGNRLEEVLVSYTNTLTYEYDYEFTDANGQVLFANVDSGTAIIQASHSDYDSNDANINIANGKTTETTITITRIGGFTGTTHYDRNCIDDGLWICGDQSIVQHSCTQDSDCELTNYCTVGINTCSRFNYSRCDDIGMPRTQKCITKLTGEQTLNNITNWMLSNLLWVIVIIILLVSAGMIFISWKQ